MLELRSVQAVYALIAEAKGITVGKPGLLHLVGQIAKADFGAAQRLATVLDPQREVDVFHVNATITGHHRFGVRDLIFRVQEALKVECGMTSGAPEGGLLLQLQVRGRSAVMGMRLRTATIAPCGGLCMGGFWFRARRPDNGFAKIGLRSQNLSKFLALKSLQA